MKNKRTVKNKNKPVSKPQSLQTIDYVVWFFKNIITGLFAYLIIHSIIDNQDSYNWAYNTLMKGNYKIIKKHRMLPLDQKWEAKLGYTFTFWKFLRDNTPEDAVILYPTADIFFPQGKKSQFTGEPANKIKALRFLYPRKLVYHNETETNRYGKQLTHVAIVNEWGYEYLEYAVNNKGGNTVMPIKYSENQMNINK
jgi:hypothetical protein